MGDAVMPTITVNKKELLAYIGKKLSDTVLADRISMLGTDVEEVTRDEVIVEVPPKRPDLLSTPGLGRALALCTGVRKGLQLYTVKPSGNKVIVTKEVKKIRPYTACAIVRGLHVTDEKIKEIMNMQEKLHITFCRQRKKAAIGIYPLEKITFPITYTAKKPKDIAFHPLEGKGVMSAEEICALYTDYAHLLKDKPLYPLFIDAKDEILSMPPLINSHTVGKVTKETQEIFIEASGFSLEIVKKCVTILITAFAEMGGHAESVQIEYGQETITTPDVTPSQKKIHKEYIEQMIGIQLSEKDLKNYLEMMGHSYAQGRVMIPAYRTDILHDIDIAEDVAIAYGYENMEGIIPQIATIGKEDDEEQLDTLLRKVFSAAGLVETKSYNLASEELLNTKMRRKEKLVTLANAITEEYNTLRNAVVPSLIDTLQTNKHNEYPQKIFTIGNTFTLGKTETGVEERMHLGIALSGRDMTFTTIKQIVDVLANACDCVITIKEKEYEMYISGRSGEIRCQGEVIGNLGEIHPEVLTNCSLEMPVVACEIDIPLLLMIIKQK